jgi:cholesterol oxidase
VLHWPHENDAAVQQHIDRRVRAIAGSTGVLVDTTAPARTIWHPLGGAAMGRVCDLSGRVQGTAGSTCSTVH